MVVVVAADAVVRRALVVDVPRPVDDLAAVAVHGVAARMGAARASDSGRPRRR